MSADPRVETWVLSEGPKPMVAQLRDWARFPRRGGRRVVLVEVAHSGVVSWPVLALVGRLAVILSAQRSALGFVVNERMRDRCERAGLGNDVPVFSELRRATAWAQDWLEEKAAADAATSPRGGRLARR